MIKIIGWVTNEANNILSIKIFAMALVGLRVINSYFAALIGLEKEFKYVEIVLLGLLLCSVFLFCINEYKKVNNVGLFFKSMTQKYVCTEHILLMVLLFLMTISYMADYFYNGNSIFGGSGIYGMFISIFVLFSFGRFLAVNKNFFCINLFLNIFFITVTVVMGVILIKLFLRIPMTTPSGGEISMWDGNRLSINLNPNRVGAYAALCFFICFIITLYYKKKIRFFYLFAAIIQFVLLSLSNSRTALIAFWCVLGFLVGLIRFYNGSNKHFAYRIVISCIWAVVTIIVSYFFYKLVLSGYDLTGKWFGQEAVDVSAERDLNISSLSGRGDIWKCTIEAMFSNIKTMFFGVTEREVSNVIGLYSGGNFIMYTHNQILEVGLSIGIPAMIVFLIWLVFIGRACWKIAFDSTLSIELHHRMIPFIVLFLVLSNMTEALLLFFRLFSESVFMILCGWCVEKKRQLQILRG